MRSAKRGVHVQDHRARRGGWGTMVARGVKQHEGNDMFEAFAPTPVASCFHLLAGTHDVRVGLRYDILMPSKHSTSQNLQEDVFMCLPEGCGEMFDKVVRLNHSLYGLKQASISWQGHLMMHTNGIEFEHCPAGVCVMRMIESGSVSIVTVVHVDEICAVGREDRCDQFCDDLNGLDAINNLDEFRWYAGCHFLGTGGVVC